MKHAHIQQHESQTILDLAGDARAVLSAILEVRGHGAGRTRVTYKDHRGVMRRAELRDAIFSEWVATLNALANPVEVAAKARAERRAKAAAKRRAGLHLVK